MKFLNTFIFIICIQCIFCYSGYSCCGGDKAGHGGEHMDRHLLQAQQRDLQQPVDGGGQQAVHPWHVRAPTKPVLGSGANTELCSQGRPD